MSTKIRKRPLSKPAEFQKAAWYLARNTPLDVVAQRVGVNINTVKKWSKLLQTDATAQRFKRIRHNVLRLPPKDRQRLATIIAASLKAEAST